MKKLVISAILALAAGSASALEVGVTGHRNYDTDLNAVGVTVGQSFKRLDLTAGFDRTTKDSKVDRWSLVGGLDLIKLGDAKVAVKAGAVHVDAKGGPSGLAGVAGLGMKLPLDKKFTATVDVLHQWGEPAVKAFDGNVVMLGVKYKF
jgi:hypothetical protein